MAYKAGTVNDFADSMAKAIEDALKTEWAQVKGEALPSTGEEDRRLLFVAIAQGVLRYLSDYDHTSLDVYDVQVTNHVGNDGKVRVITTGTLH